MKINEVKKLDKVEILNKGSTTKFVDGVTHVTIDGRVFYLPFKVINNTSTVTDDRGEPVCKSVRYMPAEALASALNKAYMK